MAEESRKRGKKKGLGGLTPEKKKKLKVFTLKLVSLSYFIQTLILKVFADQWHILLTINEHCK